MKILFLTKIYEKKLGGTYTVIKSIHDELKNRKHNIKILDKTKSAKYIIKNIKNSDVCHFFGGWDLFHVFYVNFAFLLNKKVIVHPLGFFEPWSLQQKKLKKKIALWIYQKNILIKANLVHCASHLEKNNILKISKKINTVVLPIGVNNIFYSQKIIRKNILRRKVLFFSRIHSKKGLDVLINEWNKINNRKWSLDICGPNEDAKYFEYIKKKSYKNDKIKFLKPVYRDIEKIKLFNNYDFMILPTLSDSFGLVVLECLATGLPVFTNKNIPWSQIKKFNAGWYISANNKTLKNELKKIFYKKNEYFFKKSKNSIKLANKFKWEFLIEKYIKVYKSLLEK